MAKGFWRIKLSSGGSGGSPENGLVASVLEEVVRWCGTAVQVLYKLQVHVVGGILHEAARFARFARHATHATHTTHTTHTTPPGKARLDKEQQQFCRCF